jgi:hypothetical protein
VWFSPVCRDCEQKARNEKKNADRPKAIIEQRARSAAAKASTGFDFFWTAMNYRALVPVLRAMMTPEGLCQGCGHKFMNERDIQIETLGSPTHRKGLGALARSKSSARLRFVQSNQGKKLFAEWLDEQEGARKSNENGPKEKTNATPIALRQLSLFEF